MPKTQRHSAQRSSMASLIHSTILPLRFMSMAVIFLLRLEVNGILNRLKSDRTT